VDELELEQALADLMPDSEAFVLAGLGALSPAIVSENQRWWAKRQVDGSGTRGDAQGKPQPRRSGPKGEQSRHRKPHRVQRWLPCLGCAGSFPAKHWTQARYCSSRCRMRGWRLRRAAA
jgi:hypothetical protein